VLATQSLAWSRTSPPTQLRGDRDTAIGVAAEALAERGVQIDDWDVFVTTASGVSDGMEYVFREAGPDAYEGLVGRYFGETRWLVRLIDWDAGERVRLRVAKDFVWRAGGPVKKAYGLRVTAEFLRSRFSGPLELLRFEARDLSPASAAMLRRRLERLAAEFNELAEVDSTLPARRREGVGMLLACRPWAFSAMLALRKRDQTLGQRSKRA